MRPFVGSMYVFGTSTAYADLILSVQSVSFANPGDSGDKFDVLLTDSGSPGVSIAGFNFHIQISDPDITATGVFHFKRQLPPTSSTAVLSLVLR